MQIVSLGDLGDLEDNLHVMQKPIFWEKQKKILFVIC